MLVLGRHAENHLLSLFLCSMKTTVKEVPGQSKEGGALLQVSVNIASSLVNLDRNHKWHLYMQLILLGET